MKYLNNTKKFKLNLLKETAKEVVFLKFYNFFIITQNLLSKKKLFEDRNFK